MYVWNGYQWIHGEITRDILAMEASLTDRLTKTWAVNLSRGGILK